jgi:hypothetical protein
MNAHTADVVIKGFLAHKGPQHSSTVQVHDSSTNDVSIFVFKDYFKEETLDVTTLVDVGAQKLMFMMHFEETEEIEIMDVICICEQERK